MNRQFHAQTVVMVLIVYIAVMINMVRTDRFSGVPKLTVESVLQGSWAQQVEDYLGENLGFHDSLFRLKNQMDLLLGEKMIQGVYVTEDMLLEKLPMGNAETIPESAVVLNQFYEKYGIPTYFILVPSASEIYESRLPANAVQQDQQTLIRETYAQLKTGIRYVDAYNILSTLSDEYVYYRTDSHWTSYGAYCVYQSAIQKMGFTAIPYNRYVISHMSTNFRGDLYEKTLFEDVKPDVLDRYSYEGGGSVLQVTAHYADGRREDRGTQLYDTSALSDSDMYRFYLGEPCAMLEIHTDLENDKRLLIYKDDFADCMIPFLLQHYSEICVIDFDGASSVTERLANPEEFTQVLFLCSMEQWTEFWSASDIAN